jgi:hypothetical protein
MGPSSGRATRVISALVLAGCAALLLGGAPAIDAAREVVARATGEPTVCSFRARTGHDCLGCGGTRAFGQVARGRVREGFRWNPLGAVIGLGTWALLLAAALSFATGRGRSLALTTAGVLIVLTLTFVVHGVLWWRTLPRGLALW